MNLKSLIFTAKKITKILFAFITAMAMIFSQVTVAFADVTWPGDYLVTDASFNGGNTITATAGQFTDIPESYQNVPVDSTFKISFGSTRLFLFRGSYDPITGTFSSILNRDMVQIQDMNGNVVSGITVSNANDPNNTSGKDSTVNISTNGTLEYDTKYKLVVKKYFSKSNSANPPSIRGALPEDVIIPFKTEAKQKSIPTQSEPNSASDVAQLDTVSPLNEGKDITFPGGVKVSPVTLNTPAQGEENTVTVRNAAGEKIITQKPNAGFISDDDVILYNASAIYGFTLKGSGDGANNHVKITIPLRIPADHPSDVSDSEASDISKMAIYMVSEYDVHNPSMTNQYWQCLDTTIDKVNKTATVDVTNFDSKGKDIILAVKFDHFSPGSLQMQNYSRTDHSFTFSVEAADASGIKELTIKRMNRNNPSDVKYITLSSVDYPGLRDFVQSNWIKWTDDDVKPGIIYDYVVDSATDMVGNTEYNVNGDNMVSATLKSAAELVKDTQDWIYSNLQEVQKQVLQNNNQYQEYINFGSSDSKNSVTQPLTLPIWGIVKNFGSSSIEWTSDRPDIIDPVDKPSQIGWSGFGFTEINLPVDKNGNPTEAKVTLTGKITYNVEKTNAENNTETATGIVTVPITVKWDIQHGVVTLKTQYGYKLAYYDGDQIVDHTYINEPINEIKKAAKFDDSIADTIVIQHTVGINPKPSDSGVRDSQDFEIDCHGKTIKADFDGVLFKMNQCGGSFTLKNAVIDMNHKKGAFLQTYGGSVKIALQNVKIINSENCDYGICLSALTVASSFTADNCEFSSCKVAAIGSFVEKYSHTGDYNYYNIPMSVNVNNCTFDGKGKSGYAIVNAFDDISVENSIFKGYKGNVSTGWNSSNDSYQMNTADGEGVYYYLYKGIPDGSPSAAILVKELGSVNLNGNIVTDCDNSVVAMTGEKNFSFLQEKPADGFSAYCTINGVKVNESTAGQLMDSLFKTNKIFGEVGSDNKVIIADASDRYKLTTILQKVNNISNDNTSNDNTKLGLIADLQNLNTNSTSTAQIVASVTQNGAISSSVNTGSNNMTVWFLSAVVCMLIIIRTNKKKEIRI